MPRHLRALAIVLAGALAVAGCGGSSEPLTEASVRAEAPEGVEIDPETPPDLLADKEPDAACDDAVGTGNPEFEAAFCAYRAAALEATSGPDGVSGIDPSLLSAGDEAIAQFGSDPAAAIATLEAATASLG